MKNAADFVRSVREAAPGTKIQLTVLRAGRSRRLGVELGGFRYDLPKADGWLGVGLNNVTPVQTEVLGWLTPHGAVVAEVFAGSPAEAGGLKVGDTIISLDGSEIKDYPDFFHREKSKAPDSASELAILRAGRQMLLKVKFGRAPEFIVSTWDIPPSPNERRRAPPIEVVPDVADSVSIEVLAVSPDGTRLAYGKEFRYCSRQEATKNKIDEGAKALQFSSDGASLLLVYGNKIKKIDIETGLVYKQS